MARLRGGDDDVAAEVFGRFARRLHALSAGQFDSWLRHKADPEGIVQSAYKSFFMRHRQGHFDVPDWESLWGLLVIITLRKCYRRLGYLSADRRDAGREVAAPADGPSDCREIGGREPSPVEASVLAETVEGLLAGLEGREREIVELSLLGCTTREIVGRLGCSERTVQRVRERIKNDLILAQEGGTFQPES